MFYDPTPPLSSSWSEWPGRFNMPSHYEEEEWERPLSGSNRSFSNPRLRRFDFMDDSPRMSRANSRTDGEMTPEGDDSPEQEPSRPPRVHRIPIFVEERQSSQESMESPETPGSAEEVIKEWEASHGNNNTVPRFRRRNLGSEDDLHRSRSHTSAFQRARARGEAEEPKTQPRRRRQNVTTVKVNCDDDAVQQQQQQQQSVDPKREQLSLIENVVKEVDCLKKQVETVSGTDNKHVRYLDEMLTRCMLKLDNVNTMGEEEIRVARKSAICTVQSCIDLLEFKLQPEVKKDLKSPQVTDKQVIVLPFYGKEADDSQEVTSAPEADVGSDQNGSSQTDKSIIVLPYNESQTEKPNSPDKVVIVLPYRDEKNNEANATSDEQRTVIVLPYHEKATDKVENGVIALPYYEKTESDNNKDDENMCTKL